MNPLRLSRLIQGNGKVGRLGQVVGVGEQFDLNAVGKMLVAFVDHHMAAGDQVQAIVALEKEMFALAKDLEFEAAAAVRDKIEHLRDHFVRI